MNLNIGLYPTFKCSLECKHCMHDCRPNSNEWSFKEYSFILEFLARAFSSDLIDKIYIQISGGEPLLYTQFELLCETLYILKLNYTAKILSLGLNTSGLIKPKKLKIKFDYVRISTDYFHQQHKTNISKYINDFVKISRHIHIENRDLFTLKGRAKANHALFENKPSYKTCFVKNDLYKNMLKINFIPGYISFCPDCSDPKIDPHNFVKYNQKYIKHPEKLLIVASTYAKNIAGIQCSEKTCKFYKLKKVEQTNAIK